MWSRALKYIYQSKLTNTSLLVSLIFVLYDWENYFSVIGWEQPKISLLLICSVVRRPQFSHSYDKSNRMKARAITDKIWIGPCARSDWSKTHVLSAYKTQKKRVYSFFPPEIIEQMKKPTPCITLWLITPGIWEHSTNACGSCFLHFPRVLKCPLCFFFITV